jgi:Transposase
VHSRCAGLDWAKDKHDVFVQEPDGTRVLASTFAHDERGVGELCRTLVQLGVGLVAIEPRVNGHRVLPNYGHGFSPLVATECPHWWPPNLPTMGVPRGQVRGLTPLPAVAWASR